MATKNPRRSKTELSSTTEFLATRGLQNLIELQTFLLPHFLKKDFNIFVDEISVQLKLRMLPYLIFSHIVQALYLRAFK